MVGNLNIVLEEEEKIPKTHSAATSPLKSSPLKNKLLASQLSLGGTKLQRKTCVRLFFYTIKYTIYKVSKIYINYINYIN